MAERTDDTSKLLGPLGSEVMSVLWSSDEALTVRAVMDRLNRERTAPLAYTTVMTVLSRLAERGAARRAPVGRSYVYESAVQDAADLAVRDVLRDHGEAALAYFVDQARTDAKLRERLERLLHDATSDGRTGGRRKGH